MSATPQISNAPPQAGVTARVQRWFSWLAAFWRHRRDIELLASLDDRMLADIGLTRSDLHEAIAEPRWRDPTALLIDRRRERRDSRRSAASRFMGQIASGGVFRFRAGDAGRAAETSVLTW
jgi:uncharacterized protein YjiS (DUF1127 family)